MYASVFVPIIIQQRLGRQHGAFYCSTLFGSCGGCGILTNFYYAHLCLSLSGPYRCFLRCYPIVLQWRVEVDQTARPFRFIHYDPIIQRKQKEFQDTRQQRSQLNDDLTEIQSIMKKNITDILDRGEKLNEVQNISQELMSKSNNFKWGTRKLTFQTRVQQYLPVIVIVLIVMGIIYIKFFW
jgi:hypothetical protein